MKIQSVEILSVKIPFRLTFRHSLAAHDAVESIVVRAYDADGNVGYGECVPRDYVTGESPGSVVDALRTHLVPAYLGATFAGF